MRSLRGFWLRSVAVDGEGKETTTEEHSVNGTSVKIGCSLLCHIALKGLRDVHCTIDLNEHQQVQITNYSAEKPVSVNGKTIAESGTLQSGDSLQVGDYRFIWENRGVDNAETAEDEGDASFQVDVEPDMKRTKSMPLLMFHKWVPSKSNNKSIDLCDTSTTSSTDIESDADNANKTIVINSHDNSVEEADSVVTGEIIPETETETEAEQTIIGELNESSGPKALIDLSTPPVPEKTVNLIDWNTPAPSSSSETPQRRQALTPTLLKKVLAPRTSISPAQDDFTRLSGDVHSTPMVNRPQMSGTLTTISENTQSVDSSVECSDQSTIISKTVSGADGEKEQDAEKSHHNIVDLPEDVESTLSELTPVMQETGAARKEGDRDSTNDDDEEVIAATQAVHTTVGSAADGERSRLANRLCDESDYLGDDWQLTVDDDEDDNLLDALEASVKDIKLGTAAAETSEKPDAEVDTNDRDSPERTYNKGLAFTPRKSLRTPKKVDTNRCCTPQSLSKMRQLENAARNSPRTPRAVYLLPMMERVLETTPGELPRTLVIGRLVPITPAIKKSNMTIMGKYTSDSEDEDLAKELPKDYVQNIAEQAKQEPNNESVVIFGGSQDKTILEEDNEAMPMVKDEAVSEVCATTEPVSPERPVKENTEVILSAANDDEEIRKKELENDSEIIFVGSQDQSTLEENQSEQITEEEAVTGVCATPKQIVQEKPSQVKDIMDDSDVQEILKEESIIYVASQSILEENKSDPTIEEIDATDSSAIPELDVPETSSEMTTSQRREDVVVLNENVPEILVDETNDESDIVNVGSQDQSQLDETYNVPNVKEEPVAPEACVIPEPMASKNESEVAVEENNEGTEADEQAERSLEMAVKFAIKNLSLPLNESSTRAEAESYEEIAETEPFELAISEDEDSESCAGEIVEAEKVKLEEQTENETNDKSINDQQECAKDQSIHKQEKEIEMEPEIVTKESVIDNAKTMDTSATDKKDASPPKTPKSKQLCEDVQQLCSPRSPLQDVSNNKPIRELSQSLLVYNVVEVVEEVQQIMKTPSEKGSLKENFVGLKEMLKTPKVTPPDNMVGVKELMNTPKAALPENMVGVKELMQTPKQPLPDNLVGVREMLKTPAATNSNVNLVGVRELMKTPAPAREGLTNVVGVRELVKTPMPSKESDMTGVRELMQTPQVPKDVNLVGVKEMLKTPAPPRRDDFRGVGIREMLQTPKPPTEADHGADAMAQIFKTPAAPKHKRIVYDDRDDDDVLAEEGNDEQSDSPLSNEDSVSQAIDEKGISKEADTTTPDIKEDEMKLNSSEELFDKMMDRKPIKNTYSRKLTPKKEEVSSSLNLSPQKEESIAKWVDSLIVTGDETSKKMKQVNNNLQVLSDRYSNVTPGQKNAQDKSVAHERKPGVEEELQTISEDQVSTILSGMAQSTPFTPRTTRRNKNVDLEDTPSRGITPSRSRRAASVKANDSLKKSTATPAARRQSRRNTTDKAEPEKEENIPQALESVKGKQPSPPTEPKRRGRPAKAVANKEEITADPNHSPKTKRGRAKVTAQPEKVAETNLATEEEKVIEEAKQDLDEKKEEVVKVEEVEAKTVGRRGRKPKGGESTEGPIMEMVSAAKTDASNVEEDKPRRKRGRPAKSLTPAPEEIDNVPEEGEKKEEESSEFVKPKRGKQQIKSQDTKDTSKPTMKPVKRPGRGAKVTAAETSKRLDEVESDQATSSTGDENRSSTTEESIASQKSAKGGGRSGRKANKDEAVKVQQSTEEEIPVVLSPMQKPAGRGRKRRATVEERVVESSPSKKIEKSEEKPKKSSRGGRKVQQKETELTDTDESPEIETNLTEVRKPVRGGRRAAPKIDDSQVAKQSVSKVNEKSEEKNEEEEPLPKKTTRGRKIVSEAKPEQMDTVTSKTTRKRLASAKDDVNAEVEKNQSRLEDSVVSSTSNMSVRSTRRGAKKEEVPEKKLKIDETTTSKIVEEKPKGRGRQKAVVHEEIESTVESDKDVTPEESKPAAARKTTASKRTAKKVVTAQSENQNDSKIVRETRSRRKN